ncbi:MAG: hypothetical protein WBN51_10170 [Gammaproteobacteria bacterium]
MPDKPMLYIFSEFLGTERAILFASIHGGVYISRQSIMVLRVVRKLVIPALMHDFIFMGTVSGYLRIDCTGKFRYAISAAIGLPFYQDRPNFASTGICVLAAGRPPF